MKKIEAHACVSVQNVSFDTSKVATNSFSFFYKNQRQRNAKPLKQTSIFKFEVNLKLAQTNTKHIIPRNSYLIDFSHWDLVQREKIINDFLDDIFRCGILGLEMVNFHLGIYLKKICFKNISNSIKFILENYDNIKLIIENTTDQDDNLKFEHLDYLRRHVNECLIISVCLDKPFASKYNIKKKSNHKKTTTQFDRTVEDEYLSAIYTKNIKNEFRSKKDCHKTLNSEYLSWGCLKKINDDIPLILRYIN